MATPEPIDPIQRFAALLRQEWAKLDARHQSGLDTEDLLDILWLAHQIQPETQSTEQLQKTDGSVTLQRSHDLVSPPSSSPPQKQEPKAAVYPPPPEPQSGPQSGLGAGLPLQVPAANALRSRLDLARALRPLMQKIPSSTQRSLNEEATAVQIAEQGVLSPVLEPAPERWFDLAIVVEDSPSLTLWEDTIAELQVLVEQQGAFRQIRTWRLRGEQGGKLELFLNWQSTPTSARARHADALLDPTGRRIIWIVSDCTSDLWDASPIYMWLERLGKHVPLAIVQLFPERLWARTALGIGQPMCLHAAMPGATQAVLSAGALPLYPEREEEEEEAGGRRQEAGGRRQKSVILPVISLEPEPLSRWANVTTGVGDASVAGLKIALDELMPQSGISAQPNSLTPEHLTPEQRVQQFCATASIMAQKLAGLMAAVPVSLPVVHLIQKTLLPQSRQVHVAEVFMSGLLDQVPLPSDPPQPPTHYRFPETVREKLIDAVPISKTTQVIDTVSGYISERLGLGSKSFAALMADYSRLELHQQQAIQPFAEIALSTLRRLGGDYRAKADRLAAYLHPSPPESTTQSFPPLQEHCYQVATVEVEPLQRFDFETATIERQPDPKSRKSRQKQNQQASEWVITKAPGYGWQRIEDLGDGISLELVEVLGGRFQMGSPQDEPDRFTGREDPQHQVALSDFFMGKSPVTQAQWRAVATLPQRNQDLDPDPSRFKGENRPVENVSWHDAIEFCARLSVQTGRQYGLPTEAEWEYACRAGTTTPFCFGETITTELANYDGDYVYNKGPKGVKRGKTTPIASFPANAFGLYDMHGNVWEWCADPWHNSYAEKPEAFKQDGNSPWRSENENDNRSLRGGSWLNSPRLCRSAFRYVTHPDGRDDDHGLGFRVVCRAAGTFK
ncbi:MAG: formylglycine-generating enzyme family protein [Cyanobacteria bacterium RU_5_0]|nr:formylglycine-generating enzyme family protein [Cyanobacteria bacterium RU_5_0]